MKKIVIPFVVMLLFSFSMVNAKTCDAVDKEFKQRVKTLKSRWAREDNSLENRLSTVEKKITAIDNKLPKEIDALIKKNSAGSKRDLEREKKRHATIMSAVEKQRAAYKKRDEKARETKKKRIEKLQKDKEALQKQAGKLEQLKMKMDEEFAKAEKKVLFQIERVRMQNEDSVRKFKQEVATDYQKEFNQLNKKFEEWDAKEEKEKEKLTVADKEIETFAAGQMEKVEKLRAELDKKRATLKEKKLKPEELERAEMELDIALAKGGDKLNKELNAYRKKKMVEKKKAKMAFRNFLKKKKAYKKRHGGMVKLAQKKRDNRLNQRKKEQEREEKKWERERKMRETAYKKKLSRQYGVKRKNLQKKINKMVNTIAKAKNNFERFKVKQKKMLGKKEYQWKKKEDGAEDWKRTATEEIAVKYENKIILKRKRMNDNKKKFLIKRDKLLAQQKSVRKKRQAKLNKMKRQYEQQKDRCK